MHLQRKILLFAVAATPLVACQPASAQCGYGGLWCGYDIGRLYQVLADNVPYYAAFPPVYYSYPVPRTYGYSPFAYLPTEKTPEVVMEVEPLSMMNPYFERDVEPAIDAAESKVDRTAGQAELGPVVINNPYVQPGVELQNGPMLQAASREW